MRSGKDGNTREQRRLHNDSDGAGRPAQAAVDMQDGATKGVEISDSARYMVYAIDRLKMLIDEAERKTAPGTK